MLFLRLGAWLTGRRGPALDSVRQRFVALDLETTGLDPRRDAMVSIAAIPFVESVPQSGYVTLVDPGRPIPPASTAIHGLTDAMVHGAPRLPHVLAELDAVVASASLVGYNVGFDLAIIGRERRARGLPRLRNRALDTRLLASALHPEWRDTSLEQLAARLGVPVVARHTAEGDALTAGRIFWALLPELEARGMRTLADLLWLQRRAVVS